MESLTRSINSLTLNKQNKFSWRCIERNCKAAGYKYTDKIGEECDFYITFEDHLDVPDVAKIELLERRQYYVAKTIIKRGRYNKKIIERDEPILMDVMPRTNNCCESWYNSFTGILNNHPLIYELIDALRQEQNKIESMILKIKTDVVKAKAKKEEAASNLMKYFDINILIKLI
ncbi:hypothetical protein BpHYR1_000781 [Brachionus plicatilis]|uniref:Uncharacterized protein n=1 Tax=Brachionus plicatilis TaxID=10195 RepID=A0A3M7QNK7_BRAPC|nr:hypothetical protein BpHYR1_000781 [Brachionus plicatilis]